VAIVIADFTYSAPLESGGEVTALPSGLLAW
jgi:hypothetical protein